MTLTCFNFPGIKLVIKRKLGLYRGYRAYTRSCGFLRAIVWGEEEWILIVVRTCFIVSFPVSYSSELGVKGLGLRRVGFGLALS